jgi:hypothetical protein
MSEKEGYLQDMSVFKRDAGGADHIVKGENLLITKDYRNMSRETIIFFDNLGFGWVLDPVTMRDLKINQRETEVAANRSLIKIIENLLDNPGI